MTFVVSCVAGAFVLGFAAWMSNIWPGLTSWRRAALSRVLWWGGPFGLIALLNDVPWDHALWLASAAWLGAWIPHTDMPSIHSYQDKMLLDLVVTVVRVAGLLAAPTAVFWLCGAFWFAMVAAVAGVIPCVLVANLVTPQWRGLRTRRQLAGVLFGASTGAWVTVAILAPTPLLDRMN